jgi:hypothetical protein
MNRRFLIFIVVILITASSCNFPGTPPQTTTPSTPTLDAIPTTASTPTTVPIETLLAEVNLPTQVPSSTPSITLASAREQPVNCRFGPDVSYTIVGALNPGRQAEVIGKNPDITWLFVRNPSDPSNSCWLSADYINVEGNVDLLPVVGPPEIMVTSIKVRVDPPAMNVACDALPQSVIVTADITTNGPSIVFWQWESNTGHVSDEKQLLFESGGTKTVQDYYLVNKVADYSVQVRSTLPNTVAGEANFKVICTP